MEINASQIATQRVLEPGAGHLEAAAAEQQPPPEEERPREEEEALRPNLTLEEERGLGTRLNTVV